MANHVMTHDVTSSSEDEGPLGGAGNVQISRKFSVADYSDLLQQSGAPTSALREAAPSSVLSQNIFIIYLNVLLSFGPFCK